MNGTLKSVPKIKSVPKSVPLLALFYAEKQLKVHLDTFFPREKIFFYDLSQNLMLSIFCLIVSQSRSGDIINRAILEVDKLEEQYIVELMMEIEAIYERKYGNNEAKDTKHKIL